MNQLGYKQSYSYLLLQEAREKIVALYNTQNKELANEALGHLESLYEDAIKGKNMKLALEIRKEISKLGDMLSEKGTTAIIMDIHLSNNKIKVKIAVGKGKKLWDKRESTKKKDIEREMKRGLV